MDARPNILLLQSDEHSYRFLSARKQADGGEPCSTPNLDALIRQGTHFSTTYCQMPLCSPSRIAMLCGRHSHRCGAWGNCAILPPELPTFADALGNAGYATCTVGKMHLGGARQWAGFQARPYGDFGGPCAHQFDPLNLYSDTLNPGMDMRSRTADAGLSQIPESLLQEQMVARESLAWLREQRHRAPQQPWLLYASFSRPHFPLTAPQRFIDRYAAGRTTTPRVRRSGDSADHPMTVGAIKGFRCEEIGEQEMMNARAAYFACVDFLDEMIGDFLALLQRDGLLDNTIIVYTSDHGEMAGEHGLFWKNTWHEASARVPLIVSTPAQRSGTQSAGEVTTPVSLADLFPTFCGLGATPPPRDLDGIDLSGVINGTGDDGLAERPAVITESLASRWGRGTEFRMARSDRYKYVAFRECEDLAFDLHKDPNEQVNLLKGDTLPPDVDTLRETALAGFSFDQIEQVRTEQTERLKKQFPARVSCQTPNQIMRGDGLLVEADAPLYAPDVISDDAERDFSR